VRQQLIIGVDMDNTITNFSKKFIKYCRMLGYQLDMNKVHSNWHIERSILNVTEKEQNEILNDMLFDDQFWLTMEALPYATEMIEWLNYRYKIKIVTTPWRFEQSFYDTKLEWIEKNIPCLNLDQVIFSDAKWKEDLDIIIDDKPDTLEKCKQVGMITISYAWPYNVDAKPDYIIKSWHNIPHYIKDIERKYNV